MTRLRILHFPTDVGGHPTALSRAERRAGAHSEVAVLHGSWLRYPVDIDLGAKPGSKVSDLTKRVRFMMKATRRYDVFHFNFGQSFLPGMRDLPWLRRMGKRVFVTFQGCDARRQSFCAQNFELSCCGGRTGPGLCTPDRDPAKARLVARASRHANRVFAVNPDLLHVIPDGEFLPYAIDWPREQPEFHPHTGPVRIVHAPTNRAIKGTEDVVAAVRSLESRFDVDLELIENVPHDEAMRRYRDADIVVDQLRVGWYGAFAVELMAMGKPVIAYIREGDLKFVPRELAAELPIVRATPESIEDRLAELLAEPSRLAEIGRRSRRFVERWHDPDTIARWLLEVYETPDRPLAAAASQ